MKILSHIKLNKFGQYKFPVLKFSMLTLTLLYTSEHCMGNLVKF